MLNWIKKTSLKIIVKTGIANDTIKNHLKEKINGHHEKVISIYIDPFRNNNKVKNNEEILNICNYLINHLDSLKEDLKKDEVLDVLTKIIANHIDEYNDLTHFQTTLEKNEKIVEFKKYLKEKIEFQRYLDPNTLLEKIDFEELKKDSIIRLNDILKELKFNENEIQLMIGQIDKITKKYFTILNTFQEKIMDVLPKVKEISLKEMVEEIQLNQLQVRENTNSAIILQFSPKKKREHENTLEDLSQDPKNNDKKFKKK